MRTRPLLVLCVAAMMAFIPAADARTGPNESTPTTLYFHIFDTFNKFPINTQPMDTEFFEVGGTNFPTIASQGYDFNTIYGYSTAGPVEYDFIENGRPRFHPERGIADDVRLDPDYQTFTYMYLDVRDILGQDTRPNVLPSFTFRITMRTGDDVGRDADLDAGDLIMSGELTAHIWDDGTTVGGATNENAPDEINGVPVYVPDAYGVVEFKVPMAIDGDGVIPKTDAYNIRIDWFQNPSPDGSHDDQYAEGYMRLVANKERGHLPRLELAVMNPVYIDFIHPQVGGGILLIHTGVNSPWGTYDIDADNVTLTIQGPTEAKTVQKVVAQNQHVHGLHDQNAEITYLWRFRDDKAANGEYTITMTVPNLSGTSSATDSATFIVEGKKAFGKDQDDKIVEPTASSGDDKDSPGAGMFAVLAVLGLVGVAARRWRRT